MLLWKVSECAYRVPLFILPVGFSSPFLIFRIAITLKSLYFLLLFFGFLSCLENNSLVLGFCLCFLCSMFGFSSFPPMALPLKAPRSCGVSLTVLFLGSIVGLFVNVFSFRNCGVQISTMMKETQHECQGWCQRYRDNRPETFILH